MSEPSEEELRVRGSRLAGQVRLADVRTFAMKAEAHSVPNLDGGRLDFHLTPKISAELDEETLVVEGQYALTIFAEDSAESEDEDPQFIAELSCTMAALYMVEPTGEPFTFDERDAFAETTGQFALYPYVRALFADLTARLQLPTLTLPVLFLPIETDES